MTKINLQKSNYNSFISNLPCYKPLCASLLTINLPNYQYKHLDSSNNSIYYGLYTFGVFYVACVIIRKDCKVDCILVHNFHL